MKEWKRVLLVIGVVLFAGIIGMGINYIYQNWKFQKLYQSILKKEQDILFLGRPSCGFCTLLSPILEETAEKYQIEYRYINTDSLTQKQLIKLLDKLNIRSSTFSTPRILITQKNKIVDSYIGYMDDMKLFQFFQKNHIIDETEDFVDPYPNIKRLNCNDYFLLLKEKETVSVLVGRIGDADVNAILKKANQVKDHLYFLNPSIFLKEEYEQFLETVPQMKEKTRLPILLKIKDGIIVDMIESVDELEYKKTDFQFIL